MPPLASPVLPLGDGAQCDSPNLAAGHRHCNGDAPVTGKKPPGASEFLKNDFCRTKKNRKPEKNYPSDVIYNEL
ncbi:MAG: hypothetical protein LUQ54_01025 [Methanoregula sp.]|nr:hypothetical protein [Methanoregula sp.]